MRQTYLTKGLTGKFIRFLFVLDMDNLALLGCFIEYNPNLVNQEQPYFPSPAIPRCIISMRFDPLGLGRRI